MKYWKLLFLCLAVNSCNFNNANVQSNPNSETYNKIHCSTFRNFIYLDYLKKIAETLSYDLNIPKEGNEKLIFACDCSSSNIESNRDEIRKIIDKQLKENDVFKKTEEKNLDFQLKKLRENKDFEKTLLGLAGEQADGDPTKTLSHIILGFIGESQKFFDDLKTNLNEIKEQYEHKGGLDRKKSSVTAFIKLSDYLQKFCDDYKKAIEKGEDEIIVSAFLGNFLLEYYNIYYENIHRVAEDKNGEVKTNLTLIHAI